MSKTETKMSYACDKIRDKKMNEKEVADLLKRLDEQNKELIERNTRLTKSLDDMSDDLKEERRAKRRRKNEGGFYMMSRAAEKNLRELAKDNKTASLVFSVIREHMQIGTNAISISQAAFAQILGVSTKTIQRATKYLEEKRYIQIIKVDGRKNYVVNEKIAFSGTPHQRTAVFSATVIAHESENKNWESVEKLKACPIIREGERILTGTDELPPPDQQDLDLN